MHYCMIFIVLGFPKISHSFWPASYRVGLRDERTFVISAGEDVDDEDDDETENEMIQPEDLVDVEPLVNDEERYKPLHSHVEHYNRRAAEAAGQLAELIPYSQTRIEEINNFEDGKPFIAGFKHELDEYNFDESVETTSTSPIKEDKNASTEIHVGVTPYKIIKRSIKNNPEFPRIISLADRSRRDDEDNILGTKPPESDLLESMSSRNHGLPQKNDSAASNPAKNPESSKIESNSQNPEDYEEENTTVIVVNSKPNKSEEIDKSNDKNFESAEITTETELNEIEVEAYDYDNFRAEYDQQLTEAKSNNLTFNYTNKDEPEEGAKDAIKKIIEFDMPKNCTKEEMTQIGMKALECLAFDYQHSRNETDVRRIFQRTWTVIRVWVCIYVCIAVPCWFHKGWCCCCFRCSMCFPHDVILQSKQYYAHNPPGVLMDQPKKNATEDSSPINYKPTLFELDAYEDFESAIRNL